MEKSRKRNRQTILASRNRLKVDIVLAIHSFILAVRKGVDMRKNEKDHEFTIYNKITDYNLYLKTYLMSSIPANYRDLRIHMLDEVYNLAKNMFSAIYNKGNIRMKHLTEMQVNISLLDMMTNELRNLHKIPIKHIDTSIQKLSDIKNIVYAWKVNEEAKKK